MVISFDMHRLWLRPDGISGDAQFQLSEPIRSGRFTDVLERAELRSAENDRAMAVFGDKGSHLFPGGAVAFLSEDEFGVAQSYARTVLQSPRDLRLRVVASAVVGEFEPEPLTGLLQGECVSLINCSIALYERDSELGDQHV